MGLWSIFPAGGWGGEVPLLSITTPPSPVTLLPTLLIAINIADYVENLL